MVLQFYLWISLYNSQYHSMIYNKLMSENKLIAENKGIDPPKYSQMPNSNNVPQTPNQNNDKRQNQFNIFGIRQEIKQTTLNVGNTILELGYSFFKNTFPTFTKQRKYSHDLSSDFKLNKDKKQDHPQSIQAGKTHQNEKQNKLLKQKSFSQCGDKDLQTNLQILNQEASINQNKLKKNNKAQIQKNSLYPIEDQHQLQKSGNLTDNNFFGINDAQIGEYKNGQIKNKLQENLAENKQYIQQVLVNQNKRLKKQLQIAHLKIKQLQHQLIKFKQIPQISQKREKSFQNINKNQVKDKTVVDKSNVINKKNIPNTPHIPHAPHIPHIPHIPHPTHNYLKKNHKTNNLNKSHQVLKKVNKKLPYSEVYKGPDKDLVESIQNQIKTQSITYDDIAQLQDIKNILQLNIQLPKKNPDYFQGIRKPYKGILLLGPPGTGKTLLAKAVSSNNTFFSVSPSTIASKWKGDSQKKIRLLFEIARYHSPSVIFFDEIDALGGQRAQNQDGSALKVKNQLLTQMDGINSEAYVLLLAATNRPWNIDDALVRRLQKRLYVPLPGTKGRIWLFTKYLSQLPLSKKIDFNQLAQRTKGYSGADIFNICRDAANTPLKKKMQLYKAENISMECFNGIEFEQITQEFILQAISRIKSSVKDQNIKLLETWMLKTGSQ